MSILMLLSQIKRDQNGKEDDDMKKYYNAPMVVLQLLDATDVIKTSNEATSLQRKLDGFGDIGSWNHPTNA